MEAAFVGGSVHGGYLVRLCLAPKTQTSAQGYNRHRIRTRQVFLRNQKNQTSSL